MFSFEKNPIIFTGNKGDFKITMKLKQLLCIIFFIPELLFGQYPVDSVLQQLDEAILYHDLHNQQKELKIKLLKEQLMSVPVNSEDEYEVIKKIYEEYRPYLLDSAIHYKNRNIEIAKHLNDSEKLIESKLEQAYLMAATGMYLEAVNLIKTIDRNQLPNALLIEYFDTFRHIYSELAFYTQDHTRSQQYWDISNNYGDSLINVLTDDHELNYAISETEMRNSGQYEEALRINKIKLEKYTPGTREYAIACYNRAITYREMGNKNGEKYYLALSALSDIQSSTKDHASLWMLAEILYDEKDMERAYSYIRFSWNETVEFNARLRSLQSAEILSLIDRTYQATIEKKNNQLQTYIKIISGLVILLAVALALIYNQMKRLAAIRRDLQEANARLIKLNDELQQVNQQLQVVNTDLSESNHIKEEYIGHFIKLCSQYIDKMDEFRRMVNKKLNTGQTEELHHIIRSRDMMEKEIEALYRDFDKAFLSIFPHFVEKVNELFFENEKIELKNGELLNVDLRILALVRLGISNSSQIADFLRYSVNTIYNYRAKIKNKTIYRDEFEKMIMMIR